jgi:hypothetical protein
VNLDLDRRTGVRRTSLIALVLVAALLSACGASSKPASPPGSPDHPLVAEPTRDATTAGRVNEAAATSPQRASKSSSATSEGATAKADQPGYKKLVERQTSKPRSRFTPCNLVTKAQAASIVGSALQDPLEAPQGPTCIYRSTDGKSFVTLAVQTVPFSRLKRQIHKPQPVDVSNRTAYCGKLGQPMLYVPISGGRVLSIAAPCAVAQKFAVTAVRRLVD